MTHTRQSSTVMAVMIRLLIRHRTASQAATTARTVSPTVMAVMVRLLIRHRTASQAATTARTVSLHRLTVNHRSPVPIVPVVVATTVMIRIRTAASQATFPAVVLPRNLIHRCLDPASIQAFTYHCTVVHALLCWKAACFCCNYCSGQC